MLCVQKCESPAMLFFCWHFDVIQCNSIDYHNDIYELIYMQMVQQYMTILCQVHELNPFDENIQNGIHLTREIIL